MTTRKDGGWTAEQVRQLVALRDALADVKRIALYAEAGEINLRMTLLEICLRVDQALGKEP